MAVKALNKALLAHFTP
ncbi:hypothetical protein OIU89_09430 [Escherichia coli]|nr:hypothetical protein [Escherichia coli]